MFVPKGFGLDRFHYTNSSVSRDNLMQAAEGEPLPDVAWQRGWTEIVPGGRISILPNNSLRFVKVPSFI
jgi:hypothetical protein